MALTRPLSDFKESVKVLVSDNIDLNAAPNIVDDIQLANGDSVLVVGQTNASENGIYKVSDVGLGSSGLWVRRSDFADFRFVSGGALTFVEKGTAHSNVFYFLSGNIGNVQIGTDALIFSNLYTEIGKSLDLSSLLSGVYDAINLKTSYANANVDVYLPIYTGNISGGNISVTGSINTLSDVYIEGNLYVQGNTTTVHTETVIRSEYANAIYADTINANTIGNISGNIGTNFIGANANISGNIFAGNIFSNFYWPNGVSILDFSTSTLTVGNLNIAANGFVTFGDGTTQATRAPRVWTNWDADFVGESILSGDFWWDDGTGGLYPDFASGVQSIYLFHNTFSGYDESGNPIFYLEPLDLTIKS